MSGGHPVLPFSASLPLENGMTHFLPSPQVSNRPPSSPVLGFYLKPRVWLKVNPPSSCPVLRMGLARHPVLQKRILLYLKITPRGCHHARVFLLPLVITLGPSWKLGAGASRRLLCPHEQHALASKSQPPVHSPFREAESGG